MFFLGSPRLTLDRQPVELTAAKAIALLGYLAAQREPQARDHVLGLLWAESTDEAAHKNLRNTLWTIRKSLGDETVVADNNHLSISREVWIDVREFETVADSQADVSGLKSAVALYRAPCLDALILTDAPEFEIWLTGERERLAQLNLHLLAALVEAYTNKGSWRAVIETTQHALSQD
ncbi:MAG TPA: BTAD domain-containing putative transcriptional regulator, partial [Anaerolineae bacterium]